MTACTSCHRAQGALPGVAKPADGFRTCADCRERRRAGAARLSAGIRLRTYERVYHRIDKPGLACLNCPLPLGCVHDAGSPYPKSACALGRKTK